MKWGSGPLQNISLDMLGIAPWNRGRLGVSYYHVQDIVSSISEDGLSRQRYRDVTVTRVPPSELDAFKTFNKDVLAACPDLPPFSEQMQFACMTKRLGHASHNFRVCLFVSISRTAFVGLASRFSLLLLFGRTTTRVKESFRDGAQDVQNQQSQSQSCRQAVDA